MRNMADHHPTPPEVQAMCGYFDINGKEDKYVVEVRHSRGMPKVVRHVLTRIFIYKIRHWVARLGHSVMSRNGSVRV